MAYLRCTGTPGGSLKLRTAQGEIASFETNNANLLQEVKCEINATGGNGTPDNPNPIVGYSSANITRCGVNLWDEEWELGSINTTTGAKSDAVDKIRSKNNISIISGIRYSMVKPSGKQLFILFYDSTDTIVPYAVVSGDTAQLFNSCVLIGNDVANATFTVPSGTAYALFRIDSTNSYGNNISLCYPSTDTTYHPYNGQTYAIAFGQTVYGGVLDVTRGKLHVTWERVDLGTLEWFPISNAYYADIVGKKAGIGNLICENYPVYDVTPSLADMPDKMIKGGSSDNRVYIKDSSYSDAATFKTAMNGVMLACELATPFDIDLTPVQIEQLLGKNNVYHDGNGDTEVKYLEVVRN